jgi:hypothetical protein
MMRHQRIASDQARNLVGQSTRANASLIDIETSAAPTAKPTDAPTLAPTPLEALEEGDSMTLFSTSPARGRCNGDPTGQLGDGLQVTESNCKVMCLQEEACKFAVWNEASKMCTRYDECKTFVPDGGKWSVWKKLNAAETNFSEPIKMSDEAVLKQNPEMETMLVGCFTGLEGDADFDLITEGHNGTTASCHGMCAEYAYMVMQNETCLCGDKIKQDGTHRKVVDYQCGRICTGELTLEPTRYCGTATRFAVYRKLVEVVPTPRPMHGHMPAVHQVLVDSLFR